MISEIETQPGRHPAAVALDEWLKTPEGITAQCGNTSGQYLMNRLKRAFMAGWFARAGVE